MRVTRLKTNRITNPLGFALGSPSLSWVVTDTQSKRAEWTQLEVALDEKFEEVIFSSGRLTDADSRDFTPDIELKAHTRYFWRVRVRGDGGDEAENMAWFETAKMDEPWQAQWIAADTDSSVHPCLRKSFQIADKPVRARAYVSGIGLYELEINGAKVGGEYLTPGYNAYDKWIQYQTFDVTDMLLPGKNAVGATLGQGWAGRMGFNQENAHYYTEQKALICEIRIEYANGLVQTICTDDSWKSAQSPVLFSSIYDGETYDARLVQRGWSGAGFDDSHWGGTKAVDLGLGKLEARLSLPMVIKKELRPIEVIHTPKGETVLDMGQNMVGFLRFTADIPEGERIHLSFGEILQDGCFYRDNLRTAKCEYTYISDGSPREVRQHFTFYGFRYVKVEGWQGEPSCDDFEGLVIYSDIEETGKIETSDARLNRLFLNALWGQRGNFVDVPTDCPQRDERMGWTGDSQVFSGTACSNADSEQFYSKFLRDMWAEQESMGGNVPHVVPDLLGIMGVPDDILEQLKEQGLEPPRAAGAVAWADAAAVIPWTVYTAYGSKRFLAANYRNMKGWVDWIHNSYENVRKNPNSPWVTPWHKAFHFGDWLALDNYTNPSSPVGATENAYLCAAYYRYSLQLTARAARVLGKDDDAEEYEKRADEILEAIRAEYFTKNGRLAITTQTAYVVAIFCGLSPSPSVTGEELKRALMRDNLHLTTGFIGTPWLCRALSMVGASDYAYRLLLNSDYPSWLYEVEMGATTIWERWNSVNPDGYISDTGMNSLNHYAYGSIVEWMYRNMCGISPDEQAPGYKHFFVRPEPCDKLGYARAEIETASGRVAAGWSLEGGKLTVKVTVPFDSTATLVLPGANASLIGGGAIETKDGAQLELDAGEYEFGYTPDREFGAAEMPQVRF